NHLITQYTGNKIGKQELEHVLLYLLSPTVILHHSASSEFSPQPPAHAFPSPTSSASLVSNPSPPLVFSPPLSSPPQEASSQTRPSAVSSLLSGLLPCF